MGNRTDWDELRRLGGGGQSDVFLVRTPERSAKRAKSLEVISRPLSRVGFPDELQRAGREFADAIAEYVRPDHDAELGAMKVFKLRDDEKKSLARLAQEVDVLKQNRSGLPKLLDSNLQERWLVTEYFPNRTLAENASKYVDKIDLALQAFRSLVRTVATLQIGAPECHAMFLPNGGA